MKTLLLMRHAKSSWKDGSLDDHDRPLNERGKRDAPRMGELLKDQDLLPDLLVASTARRARKTADHVITSSGYRGESRFLHALYLAAGPQLVQLVAQLPPEAERVLLIGHNPGLEELLERITGAYAPLTTAALAHVELPGDSWSEFPDAPQGRLVRLWQPRELA